MSAFERIIFAGTPAFAAVILQHLMTQQWPIAAVLTQPDRPAGRGRKVQASAVKHVASDYALPIYQPHSLRDAKIQADLQALRPDLLIVVAYGIILPQAVLALPTHACINVHASLLPRWRGAAPIQRAILAGDSTTGISIMQMEQGLDTGPVYATASLAITATMTSGQLHDQLANLGATCLMETLVQIGEHNLQPKPQPTQGVCYADKLTKDEGLINWQQSAVDIDRQVRAFNPWPIAYTHYQTQRLRVWQATAKPEAETSALPGTITAVTPSELIVATGAGSLAITSLQFAGGKAISLRDFYNAKPDFFTSGQRLA